MLLHKKLNNHLLGKVFVIFMDDILEMSLFGCMGQHIERGSSAVECRTRNQVSPDSNPPLVPFRTLDISVLSIDAPVDSAV